MKKNNLLEPSKKSYLIIIFTIIALSFFLLGEILVRTNNKKCQNFDEDKNTVDNFVCIEITKPPMMFEVFPMGQEKQIFYIVGNANNQYVVKLPLYLHDKIMRNYKKDSENFKYKIEGTTTKIYDSLKNALIKTYNKEHKDNQIDSKNYNDYFGGTYIDGGKSPNFDIKLIFNLLGAFFLTIDIILICGNIFASKNIKSAINKYGKENLERELNDSRTISYTKEGIYLTNKYVISNAFGFKVISYEDIYWVYILKRKTKGITIGKDLIACTKNKKTFSIATTNKIEILMEIISKICEKNNTVLVDYTNENLKKYKELIKSKEK